MMEKDQETAIYQATTIQRYVSEIFGLLIKGANWKNKLIFNNPYTV